MNILSILISIFYVKKNKHSLDYYFSNYKIKNDCAHLFFNRQQNYMLLKLFHQDIRAILSLYLRDNHEIGGLYRDDRTIRCGFYCHIKIIYKNKIYSTNLFLDNKFYNNFNMHIFKNIKYENNIYHANNIMSYHKYLIYIYRKYKFDLTIYTTYIHYITQDLYIVIKRAGYHIVNDIIIISKIHDNTAIMEMVESSMKKYQSRFN